jgi:serine/threonine protein kinase
MMPDMLVFRHVSGEDREAGFTADDGGPGAGSPAVPAGEYLVSRTVRLDDGLELREHRPVKGPQRSHGYLRLDNEILAGRRLHEAAGRTYPQELSRLYGDEAVSADPFALFEPYQGRPLREVGNYIGEDEFQRFIVSFLTGLCWIAAAGIAHRAISPDTVLWDTRRGAQIVDFSRSTIFGMPRAELAGSTAWVPRELRPRSCYGMVGPRDDVWAAGRLIFFVRNQGEDLTDRRQVAESGLDEMFGGLFDRVLGPPENRPTALELLEDGLGQRAGVPSPADRSVRMMAGRGKFLEVRERRHPGIAQPPDLNADIDWMSPAGGGDRQGQAIPAETR